MQREDVADDGAHYENHAHRVHLYELLAYGCGPGLGGAGCLEEHQDDERRKAPDGQVDVKTPSPSDLIRKRPADQRPHDSRNTISRANDPREHRPCLWAGRESDDGIRAGADAGRAQAGDSPSHNERGAAWGDTTNEGAQLEDEDGEEEGDLQRKELVGLAPCGLEPANRHEEGGAVPGDVGNTVEVASDLGDCGSDDGQVERYQKDTQHQGKNDENQS